jgi:hypothetical protein
MMIMMMIVIMLSHHCFNFTLEYAIRKSMNQEELELNGSHQLPLYSDDVNLLDKNI